MPSNNGRKGPKHDDFDDDLDEILESIDKEKLLNKSTRIDDDYGDELDSVNYEDEFDYDIELDFENEDYYGDYDDNDDEDEEDDEDNGFFESFTKGKMAIIAGVFTSLVLIVMVFIAAFAGREVKGQNSNASNVEATPGSQKTTPVVNKNENGEMISASLNVTLVPGYVMPDGSSGSSGGSWGGNGWGDGSGGSEYNYPTEAPDYTATPTPDAIDDITPVPEVTATPTPEEGSGEITPTEEVTPTPEEGNGDITPTVEVTPTPEGGESGATPEPTEAVATPSPVPEVPTDIPAVTEPTVAPSDDATL